MLYFLSVICLDLLLRCVPVLQVRAVEIPEVPALLLPNYVDAGSTPHHHNYHSLSHCLRTNIFPGPFITFQSPFTLLTSEGFVGVAHFKNKPTPQQERKKKGQQMFL